MLISQRRWFRLAEGKSSPAFWKAAHEDLVFCSLGRSRDSRAAKATNCLKSQARLTERARRNDVPGLGTAFAFVWSRVRITARSRYLVNASACLQRPLHFDFL